MEEAKLPQIRFPNTKRNDAGSTVNGSRKHTKKGNNNVENIHLQISIHVFHVKRKWQEYNNIYTPIIKV